MAVTSQAFFSIQIASLSLPSETDSFFISSSVRPSKGFKYSNVNAVPSTRASRIDVFVLSASFCAESPEAGLILLTCSDDYILPISTSFKRTLMLVHRLQGLHQWFWECCSRTWDISNGLNHWGIADNHLRYPWLHPITFPVASALTFVTKPILTFFWRPESVSSSPLPISSSDSKWTASLHWTVISLI